MQTILVQTSHSFQADPGSDILGHFPISPSRLSKLEVADEGMLSRLTELLRHPSLQHQAWRLHHQPHHHVHVNSKPLTTTLFHRCALQCCYFVVVSASPQISLAVAARGDPSKYRNRCVGWREALS